jgi:hypothetical protein
MVPAAVAVTDWVLDAKSPALAAFPSIAKNGRRKNAERQLATKRDANVCLFITRCVTKP